jgi:hypothetical protein
VRQAQNGSIVASAELIEHLPDKEGIDDGDDRWRP